MLMSRFWPNPPSFHQSPFAPEQRHPAHNSKGARETPWNNSLFSVLIVLLPLLPHEATCRMLPLPAACLWGSLSRPWPTLAPPDIMTSRALRWRDGESESGTNFQILPASAASKNFGKLWDFESIWWFLMIFDAWAMRSNVCFGQAKTRQRWWKSSLAVARDRHNSDRSPQQRSSLFKSRDILSRATRAGQKN